MGSRKKTILNVGREQSFRELRHRLLAEAGYAVISAASAREAEAALEEKVPVALVVGAWVPKVERNQLLRLAKARNPQTVVVFYYDQNIDDTEEADAILNFRGDHSDLVRTLQHLLARASKKDRRGPGAKKLKHLAAMIGSVASSFPDWIVLPLVLWPEAVIRSS